MAWASFWATPIMASFSALPSALSHVVIAPCATLLVAITTKLSLVDVSPSTVTRLNEPLARSVASCCINAGGTVASVAIKPSMVAMLGRIMPAPLLMPVIVTVLPPSCTCVLKALGSVSVVIMPWAALSQLSSFASSSAAGMPAMMRSDGSGSMMTPVLKGKICSGAMSSLRASAMQVARARAMPSSPVPALALPVLISMARMPILRCK